MTDGTTDWAWCNGDFAPSAQASVSIFDRGFLYGDGLFESIRVHRGSLLDWETHLSRMGAGASALELPMPKTPAQIRAFATDLVKMNGLLEGVLRINLSRGPGSRGFTPPRVPSPTLVLTTHPLPAPVELQTVSLARIDFALPRSPADAWKTTSQILHVLARQAAERAGAEEALLCREDGTVVEGAGSNLFWISEGRLFTPATGTGALNGIARQRILRVAKFAGLAVDEIRAPVQNLESADEIFITASSFGLKRVSAFDGKRLTPGPFCQQLFDLYWRVARSENGLQE